MNHVLVIDDDLKVCEMVREILERSGYRVTEAHDGNEGLAAHKADPAALLITDLVMPGKEGIETIMEFKRHYPALKIIAMSGGGLGRSTHYLEVAKSFGISETLPKPFSVVNLLKLVARLLQEPDRPLPAAPSP